MTMPRGLSRARRILAARRVRVRAQSALAGGPSTLVLPAPDRLAELVVEYWYPAARQPDGLSTKAWFRVVEGWGFRTEHSPAGTSKDPCFRIIDDLAFPTLSMPMTHRRS